MWNAISSGLQAVQDRLDNVIDTQDPSQSHATTAVAEPHPSMVGGADNKEEVRIVVQYRSCATIAKV